MALINRKTIQQIGFIKPLTISIRKDANTIYFSSSLKEIHGFTDGRLIEFNNEGDAWGFWLTDSEDGFKLLREGNKNSTGVSVASAPLARMLLKSTNKRAPCAFYVQQTEAEVDGRPVFEILTKKTIEEMGK